MLGLPTILQAHQLSLPSDLIALDSSRGQSIIRHHLNKHFWKLNNEFLTQKTQTYCGVASIVMVLNALGIDGPNDPIYAPYRPFTQDNFFSVADTSFISLSVLAREGMTLDQAASLLKSLPVKKQVMHADRLTLKEFRTILKAEQDNRYLIVNFLREVIKEEKGGHFSPIGAYDAQYDRVLLFDVSRYKYPPHWINTIDLWKAMRTIDCHSNQYRGLLIIENSSGL